VAHTAPHVLMPSWSQQRPAAYPADLTWNFSDGTRRVVTFDEVVALMPSVSKYVVKGSLDSPAIGSVCIPESKAYVTMCQLATKNHAEYSARFGYSLALVDSNLLVTEPTRSAASPRPYAWLKMPLMGWLLSRHPRAFWSDSDALFMNMELPIPHVPGAWMLASSEPDTVVNTGHVVLSRSPEAVAFVRAVWSIYPEPCAPSMAWEQAAAEYYLSGQRPSCQQVCDVDGGLLTADTACNTIAPEFSQRVLLGSTRWMNAQLVALGNQSKTGGYEAGDWRIHLSRPALFELFDPELPDQNSRTDLMSAYASLANGPHEALVAFHRNVTSGVWVAARMQKVNASVASSGRGFARAPRMRL